MDIKNIKPVHEGSEPMPVKHGRVSPFWIIYLATEDFENQMMKEQKADADLLNTDVQMEEAVVNYWNTGGKSGGGKLGDDAQDVADAGSNQTKSNKAMSNFQADQSKASAMAGEMGSTVQAQQTQEGADGLNQQQTYELFKAINDILSLTANLSVK